MWNEKSCDYEHLISIQRKICQNLRVETTKNLEKVLSSLWVAFQWHRTLLKTQTILMVNQGLETVSRGLAYLR